MQRILFVLYLLRTCMLYTLISPPKAYVVVLVLHLLATSHTHGPWVKLAAEMKNPVTPVIPGAVGDRSV